MARTHPLLAFQHSVIAVWQLVASGWSDDAIRHFTAPLRRIHDGVYLTGDGPLTDWQRWWAAILSHPGSALHGPSAGLLFEFYERRGAAEYIVRPGTGGRIQHGPLVIARSSTLAGDLIRVNGLLVTSPARTVLDLNAVNDATTADRLVRDALRSKWVDGPALRMITARHRGARHVVRLRRLTERYAKLPARRTKSDAELLALAMLDAAGIEAPAINVKRAGEEADLSWDDGKRIIELDGPSFHFEEEDARKTRVWTGAGWTVDRLPTDDVYHHPHRLLALAPRP
ncbi:MAG: hypothetical protein JHC95_00695, partial [Solirubrobacteraceae bacterium]|nr:hypothetical protein [Solirubrobacteraceae bacterium]